MIILIALGRCYLENIMIDNDLITETEFHIMNSFLNKENTPSPYLYLLKNFFPLSLYEKLLNFSQNSRDYIVDKNNIGRQKITWVPDSVFEEIYMVFQNLTPYMIQSYKKNLKFHGLCLWKDTKNFKTSWHIDVPIIEIAIQIYLEGPQDYGTKFKIDDLEIELPFIPNTGYIMDNSGKLIHSMPNRVLKNDVRYSLYGIWTTN